MTQKQEFDAVVIGAGFGGMYALHLLREGGYSVRLYEANGDVGGVWYSNRYPGARCDSQSQFYNYSFSEELYKGWTWSSVYPEQSEILEYLKYSADKLDLRRDIQFNTRVTSAEYDETNNRWRIRTDDGNLVLAKYFIPALGYLGSTSSHKPDIKGLESFEGKAYHTSHWPHEKVDFRGKRVGVIGTGSSGVQAITAISKVADHLTVFQRTPQYTYPVKNPLLGPDEIKEMKDNFHDLRRRMYEHPSGTPNVTGIKDYSALDDTPEERQKLYERLWEEDGSQLLFAYNDLTKNDEANKTLSEFMRSKIKEIVKDPQTAENLLPTYPVGGKRSIIDTGYLEVYNQENVSLVNLKKTPILECTPKGLRTTEAEHELDIIVYASGFDAVTGPLINANIRGKNGILLGDKWEGGANLKTYLGICHAGFPNMFTIGGPHYNITTNAPTVIEVLAEWIFDCIQHFDKHGIEVIETTPVAEEEWSNLVNEVGSKTIFAKVDSWFTGANIEGKPRTFLGYIGSFPSFHEQILKSKSFEKFSFVPDTVSK